MAEFWNVCTRPAAVRGGLGLSLVETNRKARLIERNFALLPDSLATFEEWRRLLVAYTVTGIAVHDAKLVASMHVHRLTHLVTFNDGDFKRYKTIVAVKPEDL
jgi:predicted nucleic acid-binding protein